MLEYHAVVVLQVALEVFVVQLLQLTDSLPLDALLPFLAMGTVWRACQYGDVAHVSFLAIHGLDVNEQV